MKIINLGCGTKTCASPDIINVDWSPYLRIRSNPALYRMARLFLDGARFQALQALPGSVVVHDLRKGVPFPDNVADAVYHSHFLHHLDRAAIDGFFAEVRRVLKPGGIHRIVTLDMEKLCADYFAHVRACEVEASERRVHDARIGDVIELMVRKEAFGSSRQKPVRRFLENRLLGDARKRGETCQWMYDRFNLPWLLEQAGFRCVTVRQYEASDIPGWNAYGLDQDEKGREYKPGSLYLEALK